MKSYVVKASIVCPSVETVINAENEVEAKLKAIALLREKLTHVKDFLRVEVRSEYTPAPEKGDYLLQK